MYEKAKVYVAGHTGLIGSAVVAKLAEQGCECVITRTHDQLDLANGMAVLDFICTQCPDYVFLAAGRVGGIQSNRKYPADYYHSNVAIQDNMFEACLRCDVKAMVFYGSSCAYPKACAQPIHEDYLMTGPIETTSQAYATAKIGGIVACQSYNMQHTKCQYIALIPNSTYGPNDNFDLENAHVLSSLIRKLYEAQLLLLPSVTLWGSGEVRREFVFATDVADASLFSIQNRHQLENKHYNIGSANDITIKELAHLIKDIVGYAGEILWDTSKPDGTARKLLDSHRFVELGWQPKVALEDGIRRTYQWYLNSVQLGNGDRAS